MGMRLGNGNEAMWFKPQWLSPQWLHCKELTRSGFAPVAQKTGSFLLKDDCLVSEGGNTAVRDF